MRRVAVLGGGPDAEREVSLDSSRAVAEALDLCPGIDSRLEMIDRPRTLSGIDADVLFPVLHGPWGEGGPLQAILEADGRPFVGSGSVPATLAMDKLQTKTEIERLGIPTPFAAAFNPARAGCDVEPPAVIKPVSQGSSVGLYVVSSRGELESAAADAAAKAYLAAPGGWMIERLIAGREVTAGLADLGDGLTPLPLIEIRPAEALYDYKAKYSRSDTAYIIDPKLPVGVADRINRAAVRAAESIGVRHLARVDFMIDETGTPWCLEINTIPGFTATSLVPKAAAAQGIAMPELCRALVEAAERDHSRPSTAHAE
ncbi:MAG: D-alanine--D-alanine ligase [Planctomycetota bacterium]